ncbi:hypothetical protein ARMSODRAFT_965781 [Armillaria solidipes]|uniref:Uncharacterized protein n=1 Tax=Armillaria solidipes TaxID=1076256 RepID=A0A2H3B7U4_9AGAR|nr:hypothetical protein ARMSODRAFT_965781 [Armillaria solidipes]
MIRITSGFPGTGRYRAIASSVYATVFLCSCYSDYVPNSSALQISKNLYQVYINSQSNIHNGLQGRDGKAIVTVKNVAPGKLPTPAEASKS